MAARNVDANDNATQSVQHSSFTIERIYDATPAQVYAAWATRKAKSRWFAGTAGEWKETLRKFDFRVGGCERLVGTWASGSVSDFQSIYHDIVPEQRIVYCYDMRVGEVKISVSLATVEFKPEGSGTRLIVTEQGAFLDGYDDAGSRERGTGALLDKLGDALKSA
jgi:uncharacterized protein YndB with AHSA1/START domain